MSHEIAFEMAASSIRYGAGVTREVGMDLADLGVQNALVVIDPVVGRRDEALAASRRRRGSRASVRRRNAGLVKVSLFLALHEFVESLANTLVG